MVDSHAVEEATDYDEIGLQGFDFNLFNKNEKGAGREGSSEFPYLPMLIKLWTRDCKTHLRGINQKVDE